MEFQWAISNPKRWCCESAALNMPANLENSAVATGLERSVFTPIPKKGNTKECSNYHTITLISYASKVMLKILQASFNSAWTVNFQMFKLDLETAEEAEIKLPTSVGSLKKQENSRKKKHLLLLYDYAKAFDCVDHKKLWKILQGMGIQRPPDLPPEKCVRRSGSNS